MKKLVVFIVVLLFSKSVLSAQSVSEIEDTISSYLDNIQKWSLYFGEYQKGKEDSLDYYNQGLQKYLVAALSKEPRTLHAKFERISKQMKIASSQDEKFRIYSWDEQSGGTMHGFYSILEYKTNMGVASEIIYPKEGTNRDFAEDKDAPGFFYPKIYTINTKNNRTIYLAIREAMFSTKDVSTGIQAFTIENEKINDSIKFFETKKAFLNNIDCFYDYFSNYNNKTMKENYIIHIGAGNQKLYVPIVDGDVITGRFLVYKFDGYKFVYDKNAK